MELYDVVSKLIGPVNPIGETHKDEIRFENLKVMVKLVNDLLTDIDSVASFRDRREHSMKKAGEYAWKAVDDMGIVG